MAGDTPYEEVLSLHHQAAAAADPLAVVTADELTALAVVCGLSRDEAYMADLAVVADAEEAVGDARARLAEAQAALDAAGEDPGAAAAAEAEVEAAEAELAAALAALRAAHAAAAAGLPGRHQDGSEYHGTRRDAHAQAFR